MGNLLVRVGMWMKSLKVRMKCKWNTMVSKLMFNMGGECPDNFLCVCKKSK
jgi:hypothetical protein